MSKFLIRHALSEANNRNNYGSPAFASPEAPLMSEGSWQAVRLQNELLNNYQVKTQHQTAAVSEMLRTQQTARDAGFNGFVSYELLNEVAHGEELPELRKSLDEGTLPDIAIRHAEKLLEFPPEEDYWVTHGLVIAGICKVLGAHQDRRLIPRFCEIRKVALD